MDRSNGNFLSQTYGVWINQSLSYFLRLTGTCLSSQTPLKILRAVLYKGDFAFSDQQIEVFFLQMHSMHFLRFKLGWLKKKKCKHTHSREPSIFLFLQRLASAQGSNSPCRCQGQTGTALGKGCQSLQSPGPRTLSAEALAAHLNTSLILCS